MQLRIVQAGIRTKGPFFRELYTFTADLEGTQKNHNKKNNKNIKKKKKTDLDHATLTCRGVARLFRSEAASCTVQRHVGCPADNLRFVVETHDCGLKQQKSRKCCQFASESNTTAVNNSDWRLAPNRCHFMESLPCHRTCFPHSLGLLVCMAPV